MKKHKFPDTMKVVAGPWPSTIYHSATLYKVIDRDGVQYTYRIHVGGVVERCVTGTGMFSRTSLSGCGDLFT